MKKLMALILVTALLMSLTACGGTSGESSSNPTSNNSNNNTTTSSTPSKSPFVAENYETGITYDQLARTPDDYKGELVKFTGKVVQVIEEDGGTTLRVATSGSYDDVILVYYEDGTTSSRVLDGDAITLYGISGGLHTYQSTMGGSITIPLIFPDKIEQNIGGISVDSKNAFDANSISEALEVVQLSYSSTYSTYVYLIIKNTSDFTLKIEAELETFSADGSILAHKSSSEDAVGAGQETILTFMLDEKFADSKYEISVSPEKYYKSVIQDLTYTSSPAKDKEIVTVTNNGNIPAEFVEGYMIFFKNDIVVYESSVYFTDDDSEIKPGKSITQEMRCYEKYDSFKIVFTGRGDAN